MEEKLIIVSGDTVNVLGVLKNYHWTSLKDAYAPNLFIPAERAHRYFSFTINLSNIPQSLDHVQSAFNAIFPGNPFDYFFLNDEFSRQYQSDLQFGELFASFSLLAVFIACLGLFALVSISASLRTREIGIRKVLGAGVRNLMVLLSREYILLLVVANILAVPVILYFGQLWLDNYAFRISVGTEIFLIPGLVLLVISILTISRKMYLVAGLNPVNTLRKE
jgi:putative ABC transport system permease protein